MNRATLITTMFLLVACAAQPATATPRPSAAEAKAREVLQHQIDVSKGSPDAVKKTFTDDAVVFTHDKATTVDAVTYFGLADGGPDGVKAEKATISKLLAGGNADAVWFYAEVTVVSKKTTGGNETSTTRVVEVATAADKWKAVAAGFGVAGALRPSGGNEEIENATGTDGPLAALLASPSSVATQLAPDAIVVGPNDAVQGASAKPTLASWKLDAMKLFKRAREIRRPTWGFAQANLDHPNTSGNGTDRLAGLVVATLAPGGSWTVVLAQYVNQ